MKQKLFTCLVVFFFATTLSATITYELNGGITNDYGWQSKNDMFQACMADCGITTLPSLDELKAPGVDGLSQICSPFNQSACQTILDNPKWDWLEAYIMLVQNADVTTPATQLTEGVASGGWRYAVAAFFLESQRTSWPRSADFSQAGKVEVFMPYWKHGFDNPTNPSKDVELNIPYNEGETFEGWYMQADFSGEQVTKVDASTTGTLYAKWTDNVSSVHIYPNDASMGSVSRSGIYPKNSEITISATPNLGYHFVQWSDGNTENPRTLELTQDTILTAEFAQSFSGQCGDNLYWSYDETTKTISISGSGEMYDYTADSIPWLLFREQIVGLTTSNTVTSIGSYAFYKCSSLTSVTIGESVTSIGNYAFYNCSSLTSVTIGESVTSIGNYAFYKCSGLTSVTIPESVTTIGNSAFYQCSSLTSVTIPNSVTSIGDYAFDSCSSLISVTIPNSVTSIGKSAFSTCSSLTSVTIGESVTSIGNYAFYKCSSLTSVTIPNSVTTIGESAFKDCSGLTSLSIGNSVTNIGKEAFHRCTALESVVWNAKHAADAYTEGESVYPIFYSMRSQIKSFTFGDNVEYIPTYLCYGMEKLTSVTFPHGVTSIGKNAFYSCSSLTSITCKAANPPTVGKYAFDGVSKSIPVYVPCGCVEAYKTASGWNNFTNIQIPLAEYSIEVYVNDTTMGSAKVDIHNSCSTQISAIPNVGYHFIQWSDGNTDAIRTLVLTQDTVLTAEFAQSFSGQCGDSLYWELVDTTLHITGNGAMYNYTPDSVPWKVLVNSIKTLTVAEGVSSIGTETFKGCSILTSVTINSDAIVGNDYTWGYNNLSYIFGSQVTEYLIGESVTSIGTYAFCDCSSLTSVTIPNSITSIGYGAFWGCSSLTSVTIPNSVTSIGNNTFSDCSSLTSVTIPNSVTSIGKSAFYGCSSLTSVTIGESVTSIEDDAFYGCSSLTSVTINSDAIVNSNISRIFGSQVTEYIIGESVTSIGGSAFYGCSSLTSVIIPNSVTSIGGSAFYGCSSLTSVTIPNSVTSIGYRAFYGCSSLTSVIIPNSVTSIGNSAFSSCSSLTSVTIPNGVTSIGDFTFNGCSSLTSITIPNSVTSIGNCAFDGCSSLTSITIPESVTSIGERAFLGCSKLTSPVYNAHCFAYMPTSYSGAYTIPEGIKQIAGSAFQDCKSLTSITIPNSVTSIGSSAFNYCSSLTSVTINSDAIMSKGYSSDSNLSHIFGSQVTEYIIGDSVTSIGDKAFYNCSSLTSVAIGESVTSIGIEAFKGCSKLTSMIIPNSVTSIGGGAFDGCSSLTSVIIPNGVTRIGDHTFNYCSSLTSITIPESVTSIGDYAFVVCSSLTSITCEATTPPTIGTSAFASVSKSIPVYVPCGCVKAYKAASGWKDFTKIQELLAEFAISVATNDSTMGTAKVDYNTFCEGNQISATPNIGYHFVQWSDGNTDAIRTLELTQDTILTAEFAQSFSGQCGDSLYWELVDTTLHITGKGEMYDYKSDSAPWKLLVSSIKSLSVSEGTTSIGDYAFVVCSSLTSITIPNSVTSIGTYAFYNCSSLTSVTIPNSVKTIGTSAFEGCARLGKISLGTGLEEIAANAFAGCTRLYDIYSYATYPPFAEESSFANYNVYVYVPCEYQREYTLDVVWGKFKFIECIESEDVTTDGNVTVVPGFNDVTITWPTEDNADTYSLVINKDNQPFCTLTFNQEGQLLNIAFAPSRDGNNRPAQYAEQAVNGYRFTVTGLTEATQYAYNITTKDAANKTIATYSGEFTTMGGTTTAVEDILQNTTNCQKILRDGQLIIVRDGVEYNAMGQEL